MRSLGSTFILALSTTFALGQVSLYIPGFDPQPLSADILGTDAEGRTTWALHEGAPTGTFTGDSGFPGTATLVEGPNDASLTYVPPDGQFTMGLSCALSSGLAICSSVSGTVTISATETATPFLVQVGTTAAPSSTDLSSSPSQQSSPSNSGTASQTSSGTSSNPSPTKSNESKQGLVPFVFGALVSTAFVAVLA